MRCKKYLLYFLTGFVLSCTSCDSPEDDILTPKERQWLLSHPNVKIAVSTNFPPFQYVDENGKPSGISVGILDLLEKKISYKFQRAYFDNWKNMLDAGKEGDIDVILEIQETIDRKEYFHFTKPYISIPNVIVMRKNSQDHVTLDDLEGLRIGVVNGYAIHEYIKEMYPELKLFALPDDRTCLLALANQKIDAFITQQGYASYEIYKEALTNLQIVGNVRYNNILGLAVRKDWSILTRIIDKGLSRISQKEKAEILNRWIPIHPEPFWKKPLFWSFFILIVAGFLAVLILVYIWNRSLRRRVEIKTYQLKKTKERAEESNLLKSSFLANMSHEIRTPLNAIQGFSELLSKEDVDPERKQTYVNIIKVNCSSLTKLIDEILDLSKIESGLITIRKQQFVLKDCVKEIIDTLLPIIPENQDTKIEFINNLTPSNQTVRTDPFRLKQILGNLINNAIKFTRRGNIIIELNKLNENEILFCIKDNGIGIEESHLDSIFDRFTKVEKDVNVLYRGSGLGLNICKKLLELMNGKIWVKSTVGVGSSFYFTLPIN